MEIKKFLFFKKIGFKIGSAFLVFSLLPLFTLGFLGDYFLNLTYLKDVSNIENNLLDKKEQEINSFFDDITSAMQIQLVAYADKINAFPVVHLYDLLNSFYTVYNSKVLEASISDEMGNEILKVSSYNYEFFERAINKEFLKNIEQKYCEESPKNEKEREMCLPIYEKYYNKLGLENLSLLPEYEKVGLKNGSDKVINLKEKFYFGPINITNNGLVMRIAVPLTNEDKKIIGMMSADVLVDDMVKSVRDSILGNTGYIMLVNNEGIAVKDSMSRLDGWIDLSGYPIVKFALDGKSATGLDDGGQYVNYFGEEVIGAARPIPKLGLSLVAEWPKSDAFSVLNSLKYQFWIILIFASAVLIIVGFFVSKRLTKPILLLSEKAKEIGKGNFEQKINIKSGDELEELGKSFEEMEKGLVELNNLKDEFVFIATHELRTPVTVIKGYLSMIDDEKDKIEPEMYDYIKKATSANNRLVALVDDLLEVARSQSGKMKVDIKEADILPDMEKIIEELQSLADRRGIKIIHEKISPFPLVLADIFRVKEVAVNLLSNAIKYNKENGTINVFYEVGDGFMTIHVKDTGIGLKPEEAQKMFSKFYRAENEKTKSVKGTGLGMFIVKNIVEKMGGKIWVESEWGKGSTFSFTLPLSKKTENTRLDSGKNSG